MNWAPIATPLVTRKTADAREPKACSAPRHHLERRSAVEQRLDLPFTLDKLIQET